MCLNTVAFILSDTVGRLVTASRSFNKPTRRDGSVGEDKGPIKCAGHHSRPSDIWDLCVKTYDERFWRNCTCKKSRYKWVQPFLFWFSIQLKKDLIPKGDYIFKHVCQKVKEPLCCSSGQEGSCVVGSVGVELKKLLFEDTTSLSHCVVKSICGSVRRVLQLTQHCSLQDRLQRFTHKSLKSGFEVRLDALDSSVCVSRQTKLM